MTSIMNLEQLILFWKGRGLALTVFLVITDIVPIGNSSERRDTLTEVHFRAVTVKFCDTNLFYSSLPMAARACILTQNTKFSLIGLYIQET